MPEDTLRTITPIQSPAPAPSPQELSRWLMQLARHDAISQTGLVWGRLMARNEEGYER